MDSARATSFGAWADEYDEWRPSYPDGAVEWLVPEHAARVVEVGAGTGKLTDRLVESGVPLEVVEPDGRMLEVISRRHPGLPVHEAGAADLPLADASVDAVVVADAWHWFPKEEAAAEVVRVLRPVVRPSRASGSKSSGSASAWRLTRARRRPRPRWPSSTTRSASAGTRSLSRSWQRPDAAGWASSPFPTLPDRCNGREPRRSPGTR